MAFPDPIVKPKSRGWVAFSSLLLPRWRLAQIHGGRHSVRAIGLVLKLKDARMQGVREARGVARVDQTDMSPIDPRNYTVV